MTTFNQSKLASIATNSSRIQLDSLCFSLGDFRLLNTFDLVFDRVAGDGSFARRLMRRDFLCDFDLAGRRVFESLVQVLVLDVEFGGKLDFGVGFGIRVRRRHGGRGGGFVLFSFFFCTAAAASG